MGRGSSGSKYSPGERPLTLAELKKAVMGYAGSKGSLDMISDGYDLKKKEGWEQLYRKHVGVLPNEKNYQGDSVVNGVDVVKYFKPWQAFGLDPKTATRADLKKAYYKLSMKFHPDHYKGDRSIFERVNLMYRSLEVAIK